MLALVEYRPTRIRLSDEDRRFLLQFVRSGEGDDEPRLLETMTPTSDPSEFILRSGAFVGRLGLPSGEALDFQSRFPFRDVIELIRLSAVRPSDVRRLSVEAERASFVIEALAWAFVREVERLVGHGLAKGYRKQRFMRPPLPGRVDVTRHISRHAARPDKLITQARRITHSILINQALASAADALARIPLPDDLRLEIRRLSPALKCISRTTVDPNSIGRIPLDNLTNRYASALTLCEIILKGNALAPRGGDASGGSILFSMPAVWESYVTSWIRSEWPEPHSIHAQESFSLTDDGSMRLVADTVVRLNHQIVALYDAKYKHEKGAPSSHDLHQMVTYCHRLNLDRATLVYPDAVAERSVTVKGITVHVRSVWPAVSQAAVN